MVVIFPVVGFYEALESKFGRPKQFFIMRQGIKAHHAEDRLAVVVDNAELFFDGEIVGIEHVNKTAVGFLHSVNCAGEPFH